MPRPLATDHPTPFERYINLVDADDAKAAVEKYAGLLNDYYTSLPEEKANYAYAPGKWTIKDVLQHVIDCERIFSYRLMRIARNDATPLPSFEEDDYAKAAKAAERSLDSLKEEFVALRKSTDLLIQSLTSEQLSYMGISGNHPAKANSFTYIIFGHLLHHKNILEERYG